jgi:hypothetical protein
MDAAEILANFLYGGRAVYKVWKQHTEAFHQLSTYIDGHENMRRLARLGNFGA